VDLGVSCISPPLWLYITPLDLGVSCEVLSTGGATNGATSYANIRGVNASSSRGGGGGGGGGGGAAACGATS
jgi:hypothetical protein